MEGLTPRNQSEEPLALKFRGKAMLKYPGRAARGKLLARWMQAPQGGKLCYSRSAVKL